MNGVRHEHSIQLQRGAVRNQSDADVAHPRTLTVWEVGIILCLQAVSTMMIGQSF